MQRKMLACMLLCCATLAHAGWFDPEFNVKTARVAGGNDQWNATQFYTTSAISSDGNVLVSREDGLYFKDKKLAGNDVRKQGATLCQKEGLAFSAGKFDINVANVETGSAQSIYSIKSTLPAEQIVYNVSPLSVTADCNKLTFIITVWPKEAISTRAEQFHGDHADRYKTILYSAVYLSERENGKWTTKEIHREKRWLSHPDLEPKEGKYLVMTWDGGIEKVTPHVMEIASGKIVAMCDDNITGRAILPFWFGDGKHLGALHTNADGRGESRVARLNVQSSEFSEVAIPRGWKFHEIAAKTLKSGNGFLAASVSGQGNINFNNASSSPIIFAEVDFQKKDFVRIEEVAKHGPRFAKNNKVLPSDEGWFPHPNISQDGRFVSFTSSNGIGEKGSDVFVISDLPE